MREDQKKRLGEIHERWEGSSNGKWVHTTQKGWDETPGLDGWPIGYMCLGLSNEDNQDHFIHFLSTERRASEASGDALHDAELIVHARTDIEYMGRLCNELESQIAILEGRDQNTADKQKEKDTSKTDEFIDTVFGGQHE